jgi:hypothetical protein
MESRFIIMKGEEFFNYPYRIECQSIIMKAGEQFMYLALLKSISPFLITNSKRMARVTAERNCHIKAS